MPDSRETLQLQPFPDALRRRLKANAALRGITMLQAAIEAVEGWCTLQEAQQPVVKAVPEREGSDHGSR